MFLRRRTSQWLRNACFLPWVFLKAILQRAKPKGAFLHHSVWSRASTLQISPPLCCRYLARGLELSCLQVDEYHDGTALQTICTNFFSAYTAQNSAGDCLQASVLSACFQIVQLPCPALCFRLKGFCPCQTLAGAASETILILPALRTHPRAGNGPA